MSEEDKKKKENVEKTDTKICLKKKTTTKRISKNYYEAKKSQYNHDLIVNAVS